MAVNTRVSRETIIVIDTSGSMGGESIIQARSAVDHALGTLHPEDAFNVIRFDSNHIPLFESTRPATADAIATARQWVSQLRADGGTNMMPALESALTPGRESRAVRQVIFVTDGAVGNESALFQTIQSRLGLSRLYTVGIGSAPNSHFMSKAAQIGRGTFTYVSRPSEVAEKMGELFDKLESPVLHDLSIDWVARSGGGITNVEAWPAQIPDVYLGEPIVIAARVPMDISHVVLHGRRGNQDVRLEIPFEGGSKHQGVANLWARRKVAALMDSLHEGASIDRVSVEVAALGVRHQLVTRWSSLVAVDVTPTAPVDVVPDTRVVPSLLPRGWDFFKIFGGSAPEASVQEQQRAARPPHTADASPSDSAADSVIRPVAINQQVASVQIGRLPQGATPAALLLSIGSVLLGGASIAWRAAGRGEQLIATSDTSEQAKPSETA
jgi:Ca-activated chloride channel family protein